MFVTHVAAKSLCDLVGDQRSEGVAGVVTQRGGDVGGSVEAQRGDREVAQRDHDLWAGAHPKKGV